MSGKLVVLTMAANENFFFVKNHQCGVGRISYLSEFGGTFTLLYCNGLWFDALPLTK